MICCGDWPWSEFLIFSFYFFFEKPEFVLKLFSFKAKELICAFSSPVIPLLIVDVFVYPNAVLVGSRRLIHPWNGCTVRLSPTSRCCLKSISQLYLYVYVRSISLFAVFVFRYKKFKKLFICSFPFCSPNKKLLLWILSKRKEPIKYIQKQQQQLVQKKHYY